MIDGLEFTSMERLSRADREKYKIREQKKVMASLLADLYLEQAKRMGEWWVINVEPSEHPDLVKEVAHHWAFRCVAKVLEMEVSRIPKLGCHNRTSQWRKNDEFVDKVRFLRSIIVRKHGHSWKIQQTTMRFSRRTFW